LALHRFRQDRQYHATYYLSVLCIYGKSSSPNLLQFRDSLPLKSVGVNSPLTSSLIVGLASQFWLRRYHPGWYRKYNYILGGALDGGAQVMIFVLSFAVFGASGVSRPFPTVSSQVIFLVPTPNPLTLSHLPLSGQETLVRETWITATEMERLTKGLCPRASRVIT